MSKQASVGWRRAAASRSRDAIPAVFVLLLTVALLSPMRVDAAVISNGDFEAGNLSDWLVQNSGSGDWYAYSGTSSPLTARTIAGPPQGSFAAVSDQSDPTTHILYRDIALEPDFAHKLGLIVYYDSGVPIAVPSPDSLDYAVAMPNQQYRIDLMKPSASFTSVSSSDILLTIFRTNAGDPQALAPTTKTADLTPFAGQTVRLRFAEVNNRATFNASVDAVSLSSTPPPTSSHPPSDIFTFGKLIRNTKKGTAALVVNVPGPGTLVLSGKGLVKQRPASSSRPASALAKAVSAAGKVKLKIRSKGKRKRKLNRTGKLKVKAKVTYTPTGGVPNTEAKRMKLVKKR